jgi:hypothetical protein
MHLPGGDTVGEPSGQHPEGGLDSGAPDLRSVAGQLKPANLARARSGQRDVHRADRHPALRVRARP